MYTLPVIVSLLAVVCAMPSTQKRSEEASMTRLHEIGSSYVSALADLYASTGKGMNVQQMKQRCLVLEDGAAVVADEVEALKEHLGMSGTAEDNRVGRATKKLKVAASKLALSQDDLLELIVGEGAMAVDHRRLTLALVFLDGMRRDVLAADLDKLKVAADASTKKEVLDDLAAGLDAVSTVLQGLVDTVDDAVLNAARLTKMNEDSLSEENNHNKNVVHDKEHLRVRRQINWNIGRGWSADLGGLHYRRGNFHFNATPTFSRGGFGARASFTWRF